MGKKRDATAPGLLWHGDEHPTLSLCQSCSIPRPWQQLLATSSSCVKSAYVLMNVSAPQSCHCCVCFNSPLSTEILAQVYRLMHYIRPPAFLHKELHSPSCKVRIQSAKPIFLIVLLMTLIWSGWCHDSNTDTYIYYVPIIIITLYEIDEYE